MMMMMMMMMMMASSSSLARIREDGLLLVYFLQARRWLWRPVRAAQTLLHFGQLKPWIVDA